MLLAARFDDGTVAAQAFLLEPASPRPRRRSFVRVSWPVLRWEGGMSGHSRPLGFEEARSRRSVWHPVQIMDRPYIGHIRISDRMAEKIVSKHEVTPEDVRDACQSPNRYRRAAWHVHPEHGRRLIVFGQTRDGRLIKVILQPVDVQDGTWRLRTALVATRGGSA